MYLTNSGTVLFRMRFAVEENAPQFIFILYCTAGAGVPDQLGGDCSAARAREPSKLLLFYQQSRDTVPLELVCIEAPT